MCLIGMCIWCRCPWRFLKLVLGMGLRLPARAVYLSIAVPFRYPQTKFHFLYPCINFVFHSVLCVFLEFIQEFIHIISDLSEYAYNHYFELFVSNFIEVIITGVNTLGFVYFWRRQVVLLLHVTYAFVLGYAQLGCIGFFSVAFSEY